MYLGTIKLLYGVQKSHSAIHLVKNITFLMLSKLCLSENWQLLGYQETVGFTLKLGVCGKL